MGCWGYYSNQAKVKGYANLHARVINIDQEKLDSFDHCNGLIENTFGQPGYTYEIMNFRNINVLYLPHLPQGPDCSVSYVFQTLINILKSQWS